MENTKVLYKMAKGDIGFKEGLKEMEKVSLSAVGGIVGAGEGMIAGAALGSLAGPVGTVVGGFVGSVVGGIAGSTAGELIAKANQKVRDVALKGLKKSYEGLKNAATGVFNFWKKTFTTTVM
jgi:phage tail tape-measure protein